MMAPTSGNPKGRKKEPPPPFPPLKRLWLPEREEEEERFPDGLPRAKEGRRGPVRGEEEEEGADLPLRRERDNARLLEIWEELWTCETTSESNKPEDDPGVTVRSRFCVSGTGRVVWASRLFLRLALTNVEPAAAVRACRDKAAETEDRAELKRAGSEGWNPSLFNMARMPDISQRDEDVTSS